MITPKVYKSLGPCTIVPMHEKCLYMHVNCQYPCGDPMPILKAIDSFERVKRASYKICSQRLHIQLHRTRLMHLVMLPLMYIMKCRLGVLYLLPQQYNYHQLRFNIFNYLDFPTGTTRFAGCKLHHKTAPTNSITFTTYT